MNIHQEHFGRKFYQDKVRGYWISVDYPRIRAHRWVWINTHGIIPKGYHIHHRNENKSDNRIENLELIEQGRHSRHHYTEEKRQFSRLLVEKIRPLTKEWHRSNEGRLWHKYHAAKFKFGNWEPLKYTCQCCNKEYLSKKRSRTRFCSNACKSQWRRDQGIDNVMRKCLKCGIEFEVNKYSKQKTCGKSCVDNSRKLLIEEMIQMRVNGFTYQEIGLKFNITRERTSKMINKYQVTHRTF